MLKEPEFLILPDNRVRKGQEGRNKEQLSNLQTAAWCGLRGAWYFRGLRNDKHETTNKEQETRNGLWAVKPANYTYATP